MVDSTKTGPLTGSELQAINNGPFLSKKDRKAWFETYKHKSRYSGDIKDGEFTNPDLERRFRNSKFMEKFRELDNYDEWAESFSPEERDSLYLKYPSVKDYQRDQYYQNGGEWDKEGLLNAIVPKPMTAQEWWNDHLDDQAIQEAEEFTPIANDNQAIKLYNKLVEDANQMFPSTTESARSQIGRKGNTWLGDLAAARNYGQVAVGEALLEHPVGVVSTLAALNNELGKLGAVALGDDEAGKDYKQKRAEYILNNMKVPVEKNPYTNISEQRFIELLPKFSDAFRKYWGTQYIPEADVDLQSLYEEVKPMLDAGLVYRAKSSVDKYFSNIVGKYQPWSSDDPIIRGKGDVLWSNIKGSAVETMQNAGAIIPNIWNGTVSAIEGDNFWKGYSKLPNLIHDSVQHNLIGDDAIAYGDSWESAVANSGYTIGAMASESLLALATMAAGKGLSMLGEGLEAGSAMSKALKGAPRVLTATNSLLAGVREGTVDAVETMNSIIQQGEVVAATLPPAQRQAYMDQVMHEAYTAYGRTMLEEALIVDAGTIMGLGFLGAIGPFKSAGPKLSTQWQRNLVPSSFLGKLGVGAAHFVEQAPKRVLGELIEEYGQGMVSGIAEQRALENLFQYETALRYGLGTDYASRFHVGFMQGISKYAPQAWVEMDPENLTKQVVASTLLFGGVHMPGMGKTRSEINADNNTKIGKIWDNIRKYSPIHTGVGDIASDVKSGMFDVYNRTESGLEAFLNNPEMQDVLQTQAALADIGIQMAQAIESNDISEYQKAAAAYYAGQAVMLANAQQKAPKLNSRYMEILQNRANYDNLSEEDKAKVFQDFMEGQQTSFIASLSQEEQVETMKQIAQRSLGLIEEAGNLFRKYQEIGLDAMTDIRPLVFDELLSNSAPQTIEENWNQIQPAIEKLRRENPSFGEGDGAKDKAIKFLLSNYFGETNFAQRARVTRAILNGNIEGISKTVAHEAMTDIIEQVSKELPNIDEIIKSDAKLLKWREAVYEKWNNMYKRVQAGEGALSRKQLKELEKANNLSSDRKIKKLQKEILKTKSVSELTNLYNTVKSEGEAIDIDKVLREMTDPGVQSKVAEMNKIHRASNSIGAAISYSSLPLELKENLLGQVEGLMNSQNSASALYDIANYSLSGVRPDEKDKMAGELSQILSSAKATADNAQTVRTNPVDSKKDSQFGQATDLSSRDVDTAPAVNKEPIKKFTPEEATKLVNEINALLAKNEFMTATPMINELQKRCPEGYQFMQGGTQVALKKIDTSTPISEVTVDESLEEEPEFAPEGEVIVDEELDASLDAYPDEDVRSITKIAIVTFEPGGREYAYPVRDEDVQMGDTVDGKSNQGKIERFETPDEYAVKHPDGDYTLEKLAKFKRGTFIDRHTNKAETAEPVPVKRVVTTHRSETQQSRLNANVTPARNEVSPQYIKDGSMTRLGDTNHTNIDAQLDENGAFRYVDEGMLNQDDELVFVVTEEEMPDGQKAPVIWEVTKSKTEALPTDGKFLGYQVINVLDQTSMSGDRGELIARIREAYEKAGKPASFLYDSEPVKVKNIVKGFIPTRQTNPVEAQSQETIASTNLKQGLVKSNGRWGVMFKSSKTGKLMHVPVVLRQIKRDIDGNIKPSISHTGIDTIETIKHNPLTQDETREVMLVVPTPTGWQAAHSVYVLKRDIQDAVENYKEAINNGVLGERLIAKAMLRFTDPKATTAFSDFLRFNRGTSERIVFDPNHNRLELGIRGNLDTTFVYASKRGETWVITEADARNILDDNEGKGFTTEEVLKRYLNALADSEDAGISVQINMDAISKDNSIIDALIDDGFLWAPNSYPGRLTMENVGFEAPLSETAEAEPKVEDNVTTKPEPAITAPKPSNPVIEEPVTTTQKIKVPNSVDSNDVGAMVPRKKKSSSSEKKISITPTTPRTEQASTQEAPLMDELKVEAKKSYNELSAESKAHLEEKGISQEEWDKHPEIHENVLNC